MGRRDRLNGKNGNGKIHKSPMLKSPIDLRLLGDSVRIRFIELCNDYLRIKGEYLAPPQELDADMLLWRTMCVRHQQGDHRHTKDEEKSTRRIAEWTYKIMCEIRNQEYKPIVWKD